MNMFVALPGQSSGVRVATVDPTGDGQAELLASLAPIPALVFYDGMSGGIMGYFLTQTPGLPGSPQGVYIAG